METKKDQSRKIKKKGYPDYLSFIKPEFVKEFFQKKKQRKKIILFTSIFATLVFVIITFIGINTVFVKNKVAQKTIDSRKMFTQKTQVIAGKATKWIKIVPIKEITKDKNLLKLPKTAKNIVIKTVSVKPGKEQQKLTVQDRQQFVALAQQTRQAEKSKPTRLLASILNFFKKSIANIDEAINQLILPSAEEPVNIIETKDAIFVDVASVLEETPASAPLGGATLGKQEKETKEKEKTEKQEEKELKESEKESKKQTLEVEQQPEQQPEQPAGELEGPTLQETPAIEEEQQGVEEVVQEEPIAEQELPPEEEYVVVEYETPAPEITEQDTSTGKLVTVSASDELEYKDVLAFTTIPEIFKVGQEDKIQIKWQNNGNQDMQFNAYDLNNNGKLDYVEWTVPHLSDQIFEIIFISKAFKLDQDRNIIEDIYDQVQAQDNNWATIENNQYVRVTFEIPLNNKRDITLYAKANQPATIEVYVENGNDKIAEFTNVQEDQKYRIPLTALSPFESYDTFDLKVLGVVEFDYVVDPSNCWGVQGFYCSGLGQDCCNEPCLWIAEECTGDFMACAEQYYNQPCCEAVGCSWDETAPTTTYDDGEYVSPAWTKNDVTVTLTCDDGTGSGCNITYYCIDQTYNCSATTTYSAPITIGDDEGDGVWYVGYLSVDNVGNPESIKFGAEIDLDTAAPTVTNPVTLYTTTRGPFNKSISYSDLRSGVNTSSCFWDSSTIEIDFGVPTCLDTSSTASIELWEVLGEGTYLITFTVADIATNSGDTNFNLIYDASAPTGGSITYTNGYFTTTSVPITYTLGTDTLAGLNNSTGKIQRKSATLTPSTGTCGTYSSFSNLVTEYDGSYTDTSVTNGNCYKYQYLIQDNATNQATYTSNNVAKIDTTAPTVSSVAVQTGSTVNVVFSEAMGTGVTTASNYTVSGTGKGTLASNPTSAALVTGNTYVLTWSSGEMFNGGDITITVATAQDSAGNAIGSPNSGTHTGGAIGVAPVISSTAPATNAYIKSITTSSAVSYTLSEAIASGTIVMTRTSGTTDNSSPHTCTLKGTALNTDAHTALDMSDTTNSCTSAQSLVDGTVYTFAFNATDAAGNTATQVSNTSITFDTTAPTPSFTDDVAAGPVTSDTITGSWGDASTKKWDYDADGACPASSESYSKADTDSMNQSTETNNTKYICLYGKDAAGNSATQVSANDINIDVTAPTVTSVTSNAADTTYGTDDVIDVDVVFSEAVTVTGTPQLTLSTGTPATTAVNYSSGSGGATLTFNYTVIAGNASTDLDYSATSSLALNSGTIKDAAGNDATLTLASPGAAGSLAANKDIVILTDSTGPTNVGISSITVNSTSQLTILAQTATDPSGLATLPYYFNETTGHTGGSHSDWQESTTFIDTGLSVNTQYTYQVKAKDALSNTSEYSTSVSKYTLANVPTTPTLAADSTSQITATWTANSNPAGTEYYIENTTNSTNSGWITALFWISSGLTCNTSYTFRIKARNGDGAETDFTDGVSKTTSSCGGGGLPSGAYSAPSSPTGGFSVFINNNDLYTETREVTLLLKAGPDIARMAISNSPDFINAVQEFYQDTKQWLLPEGEGEKTVYVKFFTAWGQPSEVVFDTIYLGKKTIIQEIVEIPGKAVEEIPKLPGKVAEDIRKIIERIAEIIKLKEEKKLVFPPIEEVVKREAPVAMKGQWEILPVEPLRSFVLGPMPRELSALAQKIPQLEQMFKDIGVSRATDVSKLVGTNLILPGLTEVAGLSPADLETLEKLTSEAKMKIPSEIVFARTGGGLIDQNVNLYVDQQGKPQQKIEVISGKSLQLIVKPDKPARAIKGYLLFKQKKPTSSIEITLKLAAASLIPVNIKEEPVNVEERLVLQEFDYVDSDNDGIWTTEITSPVVDGEYEIVTVTDYQDQRLKPSQMSLVVVVDPEGYIYYQKPEGQTRVSNAKVTLYWMNPETKLYELWPAKKYQQTNPQTTDVTGKYSFLVPEGSYYLKVEARGYATYYGGEFEVKNGVGVHENIELKKSNWLARYFDWKIIVILLMFIFLLYNFYRDKIRTMKRSRVSEP